MSREKQIEEMAKTILDVDRSYYGMECDEIQAKAEATAIYDKGYRKTFTSELASDTQKAFKEGYAKATAEVAEKIFAEIIEALADEQITEAQKASTALEAQDTLSYEVFNYAEDKLGTIVLALSLFKKKYTEEGK